MNDVKAKMKAAMDAKPDPPLEATRKFLESYCSDQESMESVRREIREMLDINPHTLLAGLAGIEALLAEPPAEEGELARLVAYEAGWVLDRPDDLGAKLWLRALADLLRGELGNKELLPPSPPTHSSDP